jgi:hypothetical protein
MFLLTFQCSTCEFLQPLLFLMLQASFLNMLVVGGFSAVADFPPIDSCCHAAVEIHYVHLVPVSAVILMLMVSLLYLVSLYVVAGLASLFLQAFLILLTSLPCWRSCCCFHSCCCLRAC